MSWSIPEEGSENFGEWRGGLVAGRVGRSSPGIGSKHEPAATATGARETAERAGGGTAKTAAGTAGPSTADAGAARAPETNPTAAGTAAPATATTAVSPATATDPAATIPAADPAASAAAEPPAVVYEWSGHAEQYEDLHSKKQRNKRCDTHTHTGDRKFRGGDQDVHARKFDNGAGDPHLYSRELGADGEYALIHAR